MEISGSIADRLGFAQVIFAIEMGATTDREVLIAINNFTLEDELAVLQIANELMKIEISN